MYTTAQFQNTDDYELAITMRMKLRDWKSLRAQLNDRQWPACDIAHDIAAAVNRAEAVMQVQKVQD